MTQMRYGVVLVAASGYAIRRIDGGLPLSGAFSAEKDGDMNIENRLTKLERKNRTWRLAAIWMAGILGLLIACSTQWDEHGSGSRNQVLAQPSDVSPIHDRLRVRTLEVVDESGRTVGRWECVGGLPGLAM